MVGRDGPPLAHAVDPAGAIVAAATPHDVELVMVRGHIRKSRALTHPDAAYLRKQAEEVRSRITG